MWGLYKLHKDEVRTAGVGVGNGITCEGAQLAGVRRADGGDEVVVARIGRIGEKCWGGGLGDGMGKCDGVRVYGATLAPPPPPPPESDKRKGTGKVDIRLPGKGNSNSCGARPVYSFR